MQEQTQKYDLLINEIEKTKEAITILISNLALKTKITQEFDNISRELEKAKLYAAQLNELIRLEAQTIYDQCINAINYLKATIAQEKNYPVGELNQVASYLDDIITKVSAKIELQPYSITQMQEVQTQGLFFTQRYLHNALNELSPLGKDFKALLETIKTTMGSNRYSCFISYAQPIDETNGPDRFIQPFLETLRDHLLLAGFNPLLDFKCIEAGESLEAYMKQTLISNHWLLIGTPSLPQRLSQPTNVTFETRIEALRKVNKLNNIYPMIPVLVVGNVAQSLPWYKQNDHYINLTQCSYLASLKKLLQVLSRIPEQHYHDLWKVFEATYPEHMQALSTSLVKQILQNEHQKEQLTNVEVADKQRNAYTSYASLSHKTNGLLIGIPHLINRFYVSRETIKQKIESTFENYAEHTVCILHGAGGVGKTEIAKAYITDKLKLGESGYQAIVWLDASKSDFENEFRERAYELSHKLSLINTKSTVYLPEHFSFLTSALDQAISYFYELLNAICTRWLLIIDNADDKEITLKYLPKKHQKSGHILLTSRDSAWPTSYHRISVGIFDKQKEALPYLKSRLKKDNKQDLEKLAEKLGYLPIALVQATALIKNDPLLTLTQYLEHFEQDKERYLSYLQEEDIVIDQQQENRLTVIAVWESSFRYAKQKFPKVEEMLRASAYFSSLSIPVIIWEKNWPTDQIKQAIKALTNCSLIHYKKMDKSYDIHPLIIEIIQLENAKKTTSAISPAFVTPWIQNNIKFLPKAEYTAQLENEKFYMEKALQILGKAFTYQRNYPEGLEHVPKLIPHIKSVLNHIDRLEKSQLSLSTETTQNLLILYWQISNYYFIESDSQQEAKVYLQKGLRYAEAMQAINYQIKFRYLLIDVYIITKEYEQAKTLLNETNLWIEANKLNVESIDLAVGLLFQGELIEVTETEINKRSACLAYYQKGKAILDREFPQQVLIEKSWAFINQAHFLVTTYANREDKLQAAYDNYNFALNELNCIYQERNYLSQYLIFVLHKLIPLCRKLAYKNDEEQFKQQLENILEKRDDAQALNLRGTKLVDEKSFIEALRYYQKACEADPKNAVYLINQGAVLHRLKRYDEALSVYHQALALADLLLVDKAFAFNGIGVVLEDQGKLKDALKQYQAAHEADPKNAVYLINQGKVLRQLKRYDEALFLYNQALALADLLLVDKAFAFNGIGVVLEDQGKLKDALKQYQAAHEADPKNALYLRNKGNLLRQLKCYDEALFVYNQALALVDLSLVDKASAFNGIGVVLDGQEKLEDALKYYREAHEANPKSITYLTNQGNALRCLKRYDEALSVYHQALALVDLSLVDKASALNGIGAVLEDQGKLEDALKQYQAAHEADPKSITYLTNQGNALRCLKRYDEALSVYHQALALVDLSLVDKASAFNGIGVVLEDQGKLEDALKQYQAAHEADPKNAIYYINQGKVFRRLKRYDEALFVYNQALALADLSLDYKASALNGIGVVLSYQEKIDDALKYYREAHEADPKNAVYLINQGNLLRYLKRYDEALFVYNQALAFADLSSDNKASALYGIGVVLDSQEKLEDALKYYREAHEADPKNAVYLINQGNVLYNLRYYEEALSVYNKALTLTDLSLIDKAYVFNRIGVILEAQGKLDDALKYYQMANETDPNEAQYLINATTLLKRRKSGKTAQELEKHGLFQPNSETKSTGKEGGLKKRRDCSIS